MFWLKVVDRLPPLQTLATPDSSCCCSSLFFFFFCIYYSFLRAHTKRCRCISVSPSHAKKALKKTAGATTWLGHGSADVQHFSPPHSLAFADHRFFAGFNNFRVKLASLPLSPGCHSAYVCQGVPCVSVWVQLWFPGLRTNSLPLFLPSHLHWHSRRLTFLIRVGLKKKSEARAAQSLNTPFIHSSVWNHSEFPSFFLSY